MHRLLLITALAISPAFPALAQPPETPRPARWLEPDKSEPSGTHYHTFSSRLAGGEVSYLIRLPFDYQMPMSANRRYPVVYWLHGLNADQRAGAVFLEELNAAMRAGKMPAMIVVLVNGMGDSFYCDSKDGKWPVESVIIKELIPHIDKTYRTVARREMRAVEGYSMGGFGAAHLGFKYPDVFGIVGVMAGALITPGPTVQPGVFEKMFGSDEAYVRANDPFELVRKNADAIRGRSVIRIAVGDQDDLLARDKALHELLGQLKIEHEYQLVPGVAHDSALFYKTLGVGAFEYLQKAISSRTPDAGNWPNTSAPSHVFQRAGVEILTFETEQDYDRLQELYRQTQDTQPSPGAMTTLYYRSKLEGSVQPYAVQLPSNYSRDRQYPLVIQLHGTNFHEVLSGARLTYQGMSGSAWIQPDLPVIYASCFGGPTTYYMGMGEEDILAVIAEAERRFRADPDRIYIMGHSMGGAGAYMVGLRHPDLFGGIAVGDAAMWSRSAPAPDWMEPQIAIQSVPKLYPNARNVDVFFKNAGQGVQRTNTEFADGIVAQGGFATTEVFPRLPHAFGEQYPYANFVTELIGHPIRRRPAEVKFYTNTLGLNRAYWVTIDRLTHHNADALVTATYKGDSMSVTTTNIDALTLRPSEGPVPKGKVVALVVDGQEVEKGALPDPVHLSRQSGRWQIGEWNSSVRVKHHGVQGPIGDAFNSRFLAVYGEGDRDLAIAELDAIRNPTGPLDIHGDFPMKAASKVTAEDIKSSNLILFGSLQTNVVLKRIAGSLPAGLLRSNSIFIYPNPENPSHYVVVWSAKLLSAPEPGLIHGWIMPLNLLPDYVVVKDGKVASGGHFDSDWNQRE